RNIQKMYTAAQTVAPAWQYVRLGAVVPPLLDHETAATGKKRPEDVPPHLGSPRALLQGFFRTMEAADKDDSRLVDALEYLDLENVPAADRSVLGGKLALKLEAVLRKVRLDLSAVPDDWNAGRQLLGEAEAAR